MSILRDLASSQPASVAQQLVLQLGESCAPATLRTTTAPSYQHVDFSLHSQALALRVRWHPSSDSFSLINIFARQIACMHGLRCAWVVWTLRWVFERYTWVIMGSMMMKPRDER